MPTYDYKCKACSHQFEQHQSMKDKPLRVCPKCGKSALERLIGTGAAIIFKGSGFYQTDYRSESYKKAAESDKPAAATESKPAADAKPGAATEKPSPAKPEPAKNVEPTKARPDSAKKKSAKKRS